MAKVSGSARKSHSKKGLAAVVGAIEDEFFDVISMTDLHEVGNRMREIVRDHGLGVAIVVAWRQGIRSGYIPLSLRDFGEDTVPGKTSEPAPVAAGDRTEKIAGAGERYVFVHVPVRKYRSNTTILQKCGIMNDRADPISYIYHEDGLVGEFSFPEWGSRFRHHADDLEEILDALSQQGVLLEADIDNRQIQFKDRGSRDKIAGSEKPVYVRNMEYDLDAVKPRFPDRLAKKEIQEYICGVLRWKRPCNYCSVPALTPKEVTLHSAGSSTGGGQQDALATVRNYQLGFTFAPFGDPDEVCHFLAWDFPHINSLVMNMDPQVYSFSDLIKLVDVLNEDIQRFCVKHEVETALGISGVCNHWAGNSIYHQHYQFFNIPELPLPRVRESTSVAKYANRVDVQRIEWPAPAYRVRPSTPCNKEDVMLVADHIARSWGDLCDSYDESYGNGIRIKKHTQNIAVTIGDNGLEAIFIPRDRDRLDAPPQPSRKHVIRQLDASDLKVEVAKRNAGVLEMLGYFVVDDRGELDRISAMSSAERKELGDSWLRMLAPDPERIGAFEEEISNSLVCISYEKLLAEIVSHTEREARRMIYGLLRRVECDPDISDRHRSRLRERIEDEFRTRYGANI